MLRSQALDDLVARLVRAIDMHEFAPVHRLAEAGTLALTKAANAPGETSACDRRSRRAAPEGCPHGRRRCRASYQLQAGQAAGPVADPASSSSPSGSALRLLVAVISRRSSLAGSTSSASRSSSRYGQSRFFIVLSFSCRSVLPLLTSRRRRRLRQRGPAPARGDTCSSACEHPHQQFFVVHRAGQPAPSVLLLVAGLAASGVVRRPGHGRRPVRWSASTTISLA